MKKIINSEGSLVAGNGLVPVSATGGYEPGNIIKQKNPPIFIEGFLVAGTGLEPCPPPADLSPAIL